MKQITAVGINVSKGRSMVAVDNPGVLLLRLRSRSTTQQQNSINSYKCCTSTQVKFGCPQNTPF